MTQNNSAWRWQQSWAYLKKWLRVLVREFNEDGLKYRAMSLVYTTLLSLAPLLAVSFSILKGFGVHNQVQPLLLELLSPLGEKATEISASLIFFVENLQVGVLGFVGFLMLFYTVISLVDQIESCFNYIWRITESRSLYRRFSDYLSVILIGPVLLFSALGIATSMGSAAIVQKLIALQPFGAVFYMAGILLPHVLTVIAFAFIYSFIPNTKVKLLPALTGGLLAGLSWRLTGYFFGLFMANSAQYSAVYSGFAVILLSMIWLYISWLILLLGGVIAFHLQYPNYLNYSTRRPHLSQLNQNQLSLMLMFFIGQEHAEGRNGCTLETLAEAVHLPWEPVAELLGHLMDGGLLVSTEGANKRYLPARDTDAILLADIIRVVRNTGDGMGIPISHNGQATITVYLQELEQESAALFGDKTLRDLLQVNAAAAHRIVA